MQKKKEEVRKIYEPIYLRECKAAAGIPVEKGHSDDNDLD